jgi:hypothetical protein
MALGVTAHRRITGAVVLASFGDCVADHGVPVSTLTDNGMVFTTRLAGGKGGRNALESELHRLGVTQKNSRPNHPTTCGKVERFQQTMKKWLRAQPRQPTSISQLQSMIDAFVDYYNHHRPHRSLPESCTPAVAYGARLKATIGVGADEPHDRVRRDRVDQAGSVTLRVHSRLHHIGVGRIHARTPVLLLVHDLHVRVVDAATGELYRDFTLNTSRDYQPTGAPKGPTRPKKT